MPASILRQLLLLMSTETIEREVAQAGQLQPQQAKLLAVDVAKFTADVRSATFYSTQLRRDCYLWFILLNMLHNEVYLERLTQHEPEGRKAVFVAECIKMCYTLSTSGSLSCLGIFPHQLRSQLLRHQLTPSIAVEYLTLVYAQL